MINLTKLSQLLPLIIVFAFGVSLTGCGGADAAALKKEKAKKAKKAAAEKEAEAEETAADEDKSEENADTSHDEGDPSNSNRPASEDKKTEKEAEPGAKKEDKKGEKAAVDGEKEAAEIWSDLIKGNKRFMAGKHTGIDYSSARNKLTREQHPKTIILGCADSRVPPEFVFDKNLGELFVVRDAGNIADRVSLGSIEYAVEHLHAKLLVIMGHESCGAVAAAVSGKKMPTANLSEIVNSISPAFEGSTSCIIGKEPNISCVELNVRQSGMDVFMKSSIIKKAVDDGELTIIDAVYHMDTGEVVKLEQ